MNYKGYSAHVEYDEEDGVIRGEVVGLRDIVFFEVRSTEEIDGAFRAAVDDYLAYCTSRGEEPDKPYSGRLLLRTEPVLHRKLDMKAQREGVSLNAWIGKALADALGEDGPRASSNEIAVKRVRDHSKSPNKKRTSKAK